MAVLTTQADEKQAFLVHVVSAGKQILALLMTFYFKIICTNKNDSFFS